MKKYITAMFLCFCSLQNANAQTGTDLVRKYFKIEKTQPVDEFVVRTAILKIAPLQTDLKRVISRLERNGIRYWDICRPGDRTPIMCDFASPKNQLSEANYTAEFFFDKNNKLKNIEVVRSYRDKVKAYTTYPTKPAKSLVLKNNLSVSSKLKDFDAAYGPGVLNTTTSYANDWRITLEYFDKENNRYFNVGVELGDISPVELRAIKKNREQLGEFKVGIIFEDYPDPQYDK